MESNNLGGCNKSTEYESIISSQKEQLNRYECRLKDIIIAYKGLAKEKAALEAAMQTFQKPLVQNTTEKNTNASSTSTGKVIASEMMNERQMQKLLMNIATLTEERNRIEDILKQERNQLRHELALKNETIQELTERLTALEKHGKFGLTASASANDQLNCEMNNENQLLTIRELKKMLVDERNLNEKLEMQLGDLKTQMLLIMPEPIPPGTNRNVKTLNPPVTDSVQSNETGSASLKESLQGLQLEMIHLKQQYERTVADEKMRVCVAEERSKRLAEVHEERVANLEARISELSEVIGKYDLLRERDKENISNLKETIALMQKNGESEAIACLPTHHESSMVVHGCLLEEHEPEHEQLGSTFLLEATSEKKLDGFHDESNELECYRRRYDQCINENRRLREELLLSQEHVTQLKQKLNKMKLSTERLEADFECKLSEYAIMQKRESVQHNEKINNLQVSFERQIGNLQDTLQKQRERSLAVMEEKDEEIKALRTSMEILSLSTATLRQQEHNYILHRETCNTQAISVFNESTSTLGLGSSYDPTTEEQHLLHYVQEIARKNVEISALRTSKNTIESTLRQTLQEKVFVEEKLKDEVARLEKEIERFRSNTNQEGSNLEYLKNVILSFLLTRNCDSRKHMTNAIAAVLKFDESEIQAINDVKI
uniref:Putative agap012521-pa-like protein n=1 Tax=Anopheles darlingi TaxID=43151 RepID=A0A2M4CU67_ANODA